MPQSRTKMQTACVFPRRIQGLSRRTDHCFAAFFALALQPSTSLLFFSSRFNQLLSLHFTHAWPHSYEMGTSTKHSLSPSDEDHEPPSKRFKDNAAPLAGGLKSDRTSHRLQQIASLRSRGIAEHIALPSLVVCGDQSSGKSSCLEALTSLPFPRQDGLCTTFATEICIIHTDANPLKLEATIIPSAQRNDSDKTKLKGYTKTLTDFAKLPDIIAEVSGLMDIRTVDANGNIKGTASFVEDILRIKVTGPTGLHLTLVDLPGLIHTASEQQTADDVRVVHSLG